MLYCIDGVVIAAQYTGPFQDLGNIFKTRYPDMKRFKSMNNGIHYLICNTNISLSKSYKIHNNVIAYQYCLTLCAFVKPNGFRNHTYSERNICYLIYFNNEKIP